MTHGEEGGPADRPLIVQFCANNPEQLLASAKAVQDHCDAVDLNLGCPQEIARSGHYGSFLQDEWDLIYKLGVFSSLSTKGMNKRATCPTSNLTGIVVNILHVSLDVPVTVKFRVFPSTEKTVAYARMLESAGAQILTCHGRIREQRGQHTGLADWSKIRAVKEAVSVPVFANGNILYHLDIKRCLRETGADAVMSAEGQLYNPALFARACAEGKRKGKGKMMVFEEGLHLLHAEMALEYLDIVQSLQTRTAPSAVKGHLFKIMRPALAREPDLRERLGKISGPGAIERYVEVVWEMQVRMEVSVLFCIALGVSC